MLATAQPSYDIVTDNTPLLLIAETDTNSDPKLYFLIFSFSHKQIAIIVISKPALEVNKLIQLVMQNLKDVTHGRPIGQCNS